MQTSKKCRYPLGGDLYAYVNTRRRDGVKIHIRHFQLAMDTKGGVKPTTRGVKMDAKTLRRLFAIKKQLTADFKLQTANAGVKPAREQQQQQPPPPRDQQQQPPSLPRRQREKREKLRLQLPETRPATTTPPPSPVHQQRTWPIHLLEASQQQQPQGDNVNNYPAAFLDVGALTPGY